MSRSRQKLLQSKAAMKGNSAAGATAALNTLTRQCTGWLGSQANRQQQSTNARLEQRQANKRANKQASQAQEAATQPSD